MVEPLWKIVWQFLIKLNMLLQYDPVMLLSIYPNEVKTYLHPKICTQVLLAALFIYLFIFLLAAL